MPEGLRAGRTCALTGANGFVGGRLRRHLEGNGWRVVPWTRQPQAASQGVSFQLGQPVDPGRLKGVDALVHCAYDFKPLRWKDIAAVNVAGSQKLMAAAQEAGVRSVLFISTLSAFPGCRSLYGKAKLETEAFAQSAGAFIVRPGLVYSDNPGGMFGRLLQQVRSARLVPTLWGANQTQYLVHDEDLGNVVRGCVEGRVPARSGPISAAHEQGWDLKQIMTRMAQAMGKRISFVPVPWQLLWLALKTLETAGFPAKFRSDSLISMVYQDPAPSFALLKRLGFECRRFEFAPTMLV
jgi:nucleoside-diphosphate-sugar epimerase